MSSTVKSPELSSGMDITVEQPLEEIIELDELLGFDITNPDTFKRLKRCNKSNRKDAASFKRGKFDSSEYFIEKEISSVLSSPKTIDGMQSDAGCHLGNIENHKPNNVMVSQSESPTLDF
jgi:hypothetical protein